MISVTKNSELISLTQLTPSNCIEKMGSKSLQNVLKNHVGTIGLTLAAIQLFQQGSLPDPLVGENACHIRAAQYAALAGDGKIMRELEEVALKLEDVFARCSKLKLGGKGEASLIEVLQKNDLDLQIPSIICPIVLGHILTISKQTDLSIKKDAGSDLPKVSLLEGNDPKKLEGFTQKSAKQLIKNARQSLAEASIQYLCNEADLLQMRGPEHVLTDSLGLQTAPLLQAMQILLASMKVHRTTIVLKNRIIDAEAKEKGQVTLLFAPDGRERCYQVVKVPQEEGLPAFVIKAVSISSRSRSPEELEAELIDVGIETIILANAAAHPQYGGKSKNQQPPPSVELTALKELAIKRGLCEQNQDLCRIYHVYGSFLK